MAQQMPGLGTFTGTDLPETQQKPHSQTFHTATQVLDFVFSDRHGNVWDNHNHKDYHTRIQGVHPSNSPWMQHLRFDLHMRIALIGSLRSGLKPMEGSDC